MSNPTPTPIEGRCGCCGAPMDPGEAECVACALRLALAPSAPGSAGPEAPMGGSVRYFGDYDLIESMASGGAATVWRARQRSLGREVAVKVLHGGAMAGPVAQARFRLEAEAVARLDHPGIVPIYEVGEHEGSPYFSMRYLAAGSLAARLQRASPSPREAAELIGKVARAVHHAHQRGLIHRDLKPGNILLDGDGEPLVADFGLARWSTSDDSLTGTEQLVGTPAYMSPEQAAGRDVSIQSDVWALGAVLYELLSCRRPFAGASPLAILEAVRREDPPPLPAKRSDGTVLDRDLATVCMKCLVKDPDGRYQSARELAEDLDNWLAGRAVRARPVGIVARSLKWMRRHPWQAAFFGFLPVPLAVALGYLVAMNWLTGHFESSNWRDGVVEVPFDNTDTLRCTKNFDCDDFRRAPGWVRLELTNAPPELARAMRVRVFGDRLGYPDLPFSEPGLTNGQVFQLSVPGRPRLFRIRFLYFQEDGWRCDDLVSNAPNARILLKRVDPPGTK
ncbi:MAG: serine/threonine-protein kinase [Limisphaerales bacterium]